MEVTIAELNDLFDGKNNNVSDVSLKAILKENQRDDISESIQGDSPIEETVTVKRNDEIIKQSTVDEIFEQSDEKNVQDKPKEVHQNDKLDNETDALEIVVEPKISNGQIVEAINDDSDAVAASKEEQAVGGIPETIENEDVQIENVIAVDVDEDEEKKTFTIRQQLESICSDHRFLDDPRYLIFYKEKLKTMKFLRENLPHINYSEAHSQLMKLHVSIDSDRNISLDEFNEKIEKVQSCRNRIIQIKSMSIRDYILRKRATKILEDFLMKQSTERSNDKRLGDIQIHMSDLENNLSLAEILFKESDEVLQNINAAHDALSRQITCIQERNKELSRGEEPYVPPSMPKFDSITEDVPVQKGYKDWDEIVS